MATVIPINFTVEPVEVEDLTTATLDGTGVFDILMRANKAHLDHEYQKGKIKQTEYATVYLGSLEHVLQQSVAFLLSKDKVALEALLLEKQIELAGVEVQKAQVELQIAQANLTKIPAEIALLGAQKDLVVQQTANAVKEGDVLEAQACKLKAEFDAIKEGIEKTAEEAELLRWKTATEKAQTLEAGVDPDSTLGKQRLLVQRQADGFLRDAEQKAAKLMGDIWSVQRSTDTDATPANDINKFADIYKGRAIEKMLAGVGA